MTDSLCCRSCLILSLARASSTLPIAPDLAAVEPLSLIRRT